AGLCGRAGGGRGAGRARAGRRIRLWLAVDDLLRAGRRLPGEDRSASRGRPAGSQRRAARGHEHLTVRRRVVSAALVVALALACAGRVEARACASGSRALASDQDQAALAPGTHRDPRAARPADEWGPRSAHGPGPAFLCTPRPSPARPSPVALGRPRPGPHIACQDACGSTRTSRGPPGSTTAIS